MSNCEVQVNGGWVDLDVALDNGVYTKSLSLRYKKGLTESQYDEYGFSEVQWDDCWIDAQEAYKAGKYWTIAPLRYKHYETYKEADMLHKDTVKLGTMVVYHGRDLELRGMWAIVSAVQEWDARDTDYRLIILNYDDSYDGLSIEVMADITCPAFRDDFTVALKPDIPEPPMREGHYVSKDTAKLYMRENGKWYFFRVDSDPSHWSQLDSWTDNTVRDTLTFLGDL
jgi:hypothetical protein